MRSLLEAWHVALAQPGNIANISFLNKTVQQSHMLKGKKELVVDVRLTDGQSHYIVEVQHSAERDFPDRAITYAAADILEQHNAQGHFLPTHLIAFCDHDFGPGVGPGTLSVAQKRWRVSNRFVPDQEKAFVHFRLQQQSIRGFKEHASLGAALAARLSLSFVMLPHVPRLAELSTETPPLLKWSSFVAHLQPHTIDQVPGELKNEPGIQQLLEIMADPTMKNTITEEEIRHAAALEWARKEVLFEAEEKFQPIIEEKDTALQKKEAALQKKDAEIQKREVELQKKEAEITLLKSRLASKN